MMILVVAVLGQGMGLAEFLLGKTDCKRCPQPAKLHLGLAVRGQGLALVESLP